MKYESVAVATMNKNIKKSQSRIGFVGALYFIGALAMLAFACLPMLNINGKALWVVDFWKPLINIFKKKFDILGIAVAVLYAVMLLGCLIRFFKCFSNLGWLSKRTLKYVDGYDRNLKAMDGLGKKFSSSFSAIISFSLLIWVLQAPATKVTVNMLAYAMLGAGLLIHFLAGVIGCGLNYYSCGADNKFLEEKRPYSVFVYFFRNLVQVLATAGIVFFFVKSNAIGATVETLLVKKNPFAGNVLKTVVPVALDFLVLVCVFVLIKHATNITEYNLDGIFGKGMKNYRVFAFFVTLLAGGAFALDCIAGSKPVSKNSLFVAIIAFVAFLLDCIFKSKHRQETVRDEMEEDEEMDDMPKNMPAPAVAPATQNVPPQMQTINNYYGYPQGEQQQQVPPTAYSCQPIFIPVYQPFAQQPEKTEETEEELELEAFDADKRWEVTCPNCGKRLMVRDVAEYHRCPVCQKVFVVRVKERLDVNFKK